MNKFIPWLFVILMPFGMLSEPVALGPNYVWATIPFSTLVCWAYVIMERIGEMSENSFQGSAQNVPITAMARSIEIDIREMFDEQDLPKLLLAQGDLLY